MGCRAVNCPPRRRGWLFAATFGTLLSRPLGAQPAPSAQFPAEPAPAGSMAAPTGAAPAPSSDAPAAYPPPVSYSSPAAYPPPPSAAPQDPRAALTGNEPARAVAAERHGPEEHPSPEVGWSLGAGIGLGESFGGVGFASGFGSGINPAAPLTPSYRLALERRLGRNTWLAFNAAFSYSHTDQPITFSSTTTPRTRDTLELEGAQEALLIGIRQVAARGFVDVSIYGFVAGAHSKTRGDMPAPGENVSTLPGGRGNALGVVGGIAVERELIDSLALRLSADIIGASFAKQSEVKIDSTTGAETTSERTSQGAGLALRPGIQVQFYF